MDLEEGLARLELRALIDEYAYCADSRDYDGWATTFTEDGTCAGYNPGEDEPFVSATGREAIAQLLHGNDPLPHTFHSMSNHHITVDGDTASGITYGQAHHTIGTGPDTEAYVWLIQYHDDYERTSDGWKFARREIRIQWIEYVDSDVSAFPFRKGRAALASAD
ncbi:hypothetical protein BH09ACT10_BH09ACT10_30180 [soil metagenome]